MVVTFRWREAGAKSANDAEYCMDCASTTLTDGGIVFGIFYSSHPHQIKDCWCKYGRYSFCGGDKVTLERIFWVMSAVFFQGNNTFECKFFSVHSIPTANNSRSADNVCVLKFSKRASKNICRIKKIVPLNVQSAKNLQTRLSTGSLVP